MQIPLHINLIKWNSVRIITLSIISKTADKSLCNILLRCIRLRTR